MINQYKNFICIDCSVMTMGYEYYMVTDKVWLKANPKEKGMLCIGCLEERLGRKLKNKDFTKCLLNMNIALGADYSNSERLLDRILN